MKKKSYKIGDIYQGGYSSLEPSYGDFFTGAISDAGSIGLTTDARSANVLKEVSDKLSSGGKTLEITQVFPEYFNSIPKQQLKEVHRMSKLVGADITLHAPVVGLDPSGMDKQGNFSDIQREMVEREMINVIERAQDIRPEGGLPITFHAAEGIPGTYPEKTPKGSRELFVVNLDTNALAKIPLERDRFLVGGEKEEPLDKEKEIQILNNTEWQNSLASLGTSQHQVNQVLSPMDTAPLMPLFAQQKKGEPVQLTNKNQEAAIEKLYKSRIFIDNAEATFNTLFNKAYKYGDKETKEKLKEISDYWIKETNKMREDIQKRGDSPLQNAELILRKKELIDRATHGFIEKKPDGSSGIKIVGLANIEAPEIFKTADEFAEERASKTFGNVAFEAFKKFGDKAPIISIEHSYAGGAFSTGEDLKKVIESSKKEFIKNAVESGISKPQAKKSADKIIGATWDVGRLNTLRKYGFTEEELIKETEKIAPLVKHVHLSDNFGMEATELPMGMGNVPIKEIMKKLGEKGFEGKKIVEAMHWWQHFKTPPLQQTFEGMGATMNTAASGPYWSQAQGLTQGYMSGYGQMLPQINYQTFGAGFSQLPQELGGQVQGAQGSRMSGRGME
jgi:hypothetical protein